MHKLLEIARELKKVSRPTLKLENSVCIRQAHVYNPSVTCNAYQHPTGIFGRTLLSGCQPSARGT